MHINLNPIHHRLSWLVLPSGQWEWAQGAPFKISKTKNDLSMKLFSQKHVSVVSVFCLFLCFVCVMWCDYDFISMITPCKLRKLDIALVYQKSFGIVYIFAIYVFSVSYCYTWNKKTVNNQRIQLFWGESGQCSGKHHILDFREGANNWTTTPLTPNFWKKNLIQKFNPKYLQILWKFHFLKIPDTPKTKESASCTMCLHHPSPPSPSPPPPMANRLNPNNFIRNWMCNVVLQKSAVEISEVSVWYRKSVQLMFWKVNNNT